MRTFIAAFSLLLAFGAQARDPLDAADTSNAKALHDKSCTSCHSRLYGGDGSKIYTRDNRILSNKQQLLQRVAVCNAQAKAGWRPEEETAVAAWLNQRYYHFKN